jgi:AbrB family looped-hinge helix DNA binding protein
MTATHAHRVGPKGQVVIPKHLRDALGLHPGDEVDFEFDGMKITIEPRRERASMRGRFKGSGLAEGLLEDRARERD